MPFGGFAPLPFRCTNDELTGVTAAQWLRMTADIAAFAAVRCLAIVTIDCDATPEVVAYAGCDGVGVGSAPTVAYVSAGTADITWSTAYTDDHETTRNFVITAAEVQGHVYGGTTLIDVGECVIGSTKASVRITTTDTSGAAADGRVTVFVWGLFGEETDPTSYGGDLDKRECITERVPHAFAFYQEYGALLGSAFTQEKTGYVHAIKLALARLSGAEMRDVERYTNNAMPLLAGDAVERWCEALEIPFVESMSPTMRRRLLGGRLAAAQGPSIDAVDEAVGQLLGTNLIQVHRYTSNDLDDPPEITRWPSGTPGSPGMDIGGGAWYSSRSHVFVEVVSPNMTDWANYRELLDVHLTRLLDTILPAHATFAWGSTDVGGFILDVSLLDVDAL